MLPTRLERDERLGLTNVKRGKRISCILSGGGMPFGSGRWAIAGLVVCSLSAITDRLYAADDNSSAYRILQKNCFTCHGAARTSGLDLRTSETALAGGAHGAVIVASDPEQSRLYKVLTHEAEPAMP